MRSGNSPQECAAFLMEIFDGYRPRKYPELPPLVPTGVRWHGGEAAPVIALSGRDRSDKWVLITPAPAAGGTAAGIFTLESLFDDIGHWKMRDSSLTSTWMWPARTVTLTPPPVGDELIGATLAANGYPETPDNHVRMASIMFDQFPAKAYTFIDRKDGEVAAKRFVDEQHQRADYSSLAGPWRLWRKR